MVLVALVTNYPSVPSFEREAEVGEPSEVLPSRGLADVCGVGDLGGRSWLACSAYDPLDAVEPVGALDPRLDRRLVWIER